jgi:hypothetical protein
MAHKETEYSLRSTKWTTMMDVPARHFIIETDYLTIVVFYDNLVHPRTDINISPVD